MKSKLILDEKNGRPLRYVHGLGKHNTKQNPCPICIHNDRIRKKIVDTLFAHKRTVTTRHEGGWTSTIDHFPQLDNQGNFLKDNHGEYVYGPRINLIRYPGQKHCRKRAKRRFGSGISRRKWKAHKKAWKEYFCEKATLDSLVWKNQQKQVDEINRKNQESLAKRRQSDSNSNKRRV